MAGGQEYLPIFKKMRGAKALVVGGGGVALRKCRGLLAVDAKVSVVAPHLCPELRKLSSVRSSQRSFRRSDLRGAALVVAATDSLEVNLNVAGEACRLGIPVNVVDSPQHSTFIMPAILRRGPITVAVSTGGASPALARNLRDQIALHLPPQAGRHAAFLARIRSRVLKGVADPRARRKILERMAEDDVRVMIESGGVRNAYALLGELIRQHGKSEGKK